MLKHARCGKKLPQLIEDTLASFPVPQRLRLMFQDEARFGRISDCRYCWCKKPLRPLIKAMLSHQYVYAYAAVSPQDGRLDSLVLPEVSGECMHIFLTEVASRYPTENIVTVIDGAGWHKSQRLEPPVKLKLLFLYLPTRLNSIRKSTSGMSCAKSGSTTKPLTRSICWRITW
jgi:DDE superfamily endonuclease